MGIYKQVNFENISEEQTGLLIAELNLLGYDGFEEIQNGLKAFIPVADFNEKDLEQISADLQTNYSIADIEETNWNAVWESNFSPVVVDDFAAIRAHFHDPITSVEYEIVITPKMSFGTGHHATTHLMIQQMKALAVEGKKVFDFGTGTGVLAVLAEKLGAAEVIAVDNDDWSIENTNENIEKNNCSHIKVAKSDDADVGEVFDIILANINRNVLLDNMVVLQQQLISNGLLLMSGLLLEDEPIIKAAAENAGLHFVQTNQRNGWISMLFSE